MHGKNWIRKSITFLAIFAVWSVTSMVALAAPTDATGVINVTGQVTVNGQPAVSNSTFISGGTIATGADSTAVVSLGKTGRIELLADTTLTLKFTENSIIGIMSAGKARVSNAAGVATTFTTKDSTILADAGQANTFAIEIECSHTHVDTLSGLITMRTGTNDKQVAAGTDAVAGNLSQTGCKPCLRPGTVIPVPVASIGAGALAAILLAVAGTVGAGILLGSGGSDTTTGGGTIVVSPTR
ncbi:MAG TPA: hypothetical protein VF599_02580 [Pyrinomonadaceae bacterium]|jgi:hypothetical protein